MSKTLYVDTNIIMDFLVGRDSRAYAFFKKTLACSYTAMISEVVLQELHFQELDPTLFIKYVGRKLFIVAVNDNHKVLAKKYSKHTHYHDALHAAIAQIEGVDALLTQNIKDFTFFDKAITYDGL